jgi:hypothetical protein
MDYDDYKGMKNDDGQYYDNEDNKIEDELKQ